MRRLSLLFFLSSFTASCGQVDATSETQAPASGSGSGSASVSTVPGVPYTPERESNKGQVSAALGVEFPLGPTTFHASAAFSTYDGVEGEIPDRFRAAEWKVVDCKKHVVGACELIWCRYEPAPNDVHLPRQASAGTITITRENGETLTMTERPYSASSENPAASLYGERVTISASGGEVPAFTASVEFEVPIKLTSTPRIELAKGEDAMVTWDAHEKGTLVLYSREGGNRLLETTCRFDATLGKGIIPGALLEVLPIHHLRFTAGTEAKVVTVGNYQIAVGALHGYDFYDPTGNGVELVWARD